MALGGGVFTTQNKILPGAYINFVSIPNASSALSERGIATIALEMDWGAEQRMFTVHAEDIPTDSLKLFGYSNLDNTLRPVGEIFKHCKTVHFFRLNTGGTKASCKYATAKYPGTRGNALKIVIEANEKSQSEALLYDVSTYFDTVLVDAQFGVAAMTDLKNNDYVDWQNSASLELTAATPLTSGSNGSAEDATYQTYLDQAESYVFHAMGCMSASETVKKLFAAFCERMRDKMGKKIQCVVWNHLADYEGVVSVKNKIVGEENGIDLIPWVTGVLVGTAVNASASSLKYDGVYQINTDYTQAELEQGIQEGSFLFHAVNDKVAVLEDINTFVSVTGEKQGDFSNNQTIRVLDQIANDIALLFAEKYHGKIQNKQDGRISLWNDIVKHHSELQNIGAIEAFSPDAVTVEPGQSKKAVVVTDHIKPVNAMAQLYMTVYVQ